MRITSLVENTTKSELKTKHGLSLYIETKSHKILFDLGSDSTLILWQISMCKRKPLNHITVKPYFLKYQLELIVSLNLIGKSNY